MTASLADKLVTRINNDMRQAMKNKDSVTLAELRSLLARISNAESVPLEAHQGETEVSRKVLTFEDIRSIISDEIRELQAALESVDSASHYGGELQEKIAVVKKYVD